MAGVFQDIASSFNKGDSAIRKLIFIQIAVFLLFTILGRFDALDGFLKLFALPSDASVFIRQPWSLLTYIFLHAGFFHILSNTLFLYFIGTIFRDLVGNAPIYRNFIWGGIAGGGLYLVFYNVVPGFAGQGLNYMVGASGGVTAVIVAAAVFSPDYEIRLFGVLSVKLKWIAVFRVLMDLLNLGDGNNDGGQLAHLGGAAFGYLYVKWMRGEIKLPNLSGVFFSKPSAKKPPRPFKVHINNSEKNANKSTLNTNKTPQKELDDILDKISKSGYDSLTKKEKEALFKASKEL